MAPPGARWWWPSDEPPTVGPLSCRMPGCDAPRFTDRSALCREHHNTRRRERYAARSPAQRERDAAKLAAWGKANRAARLRYCARQHGATIIVAFTDDQLTARLSMWPGCWLCGRVGPLQIDHVKPLAAGGPHCLANLRPACPTCNWIKGDRWPLTLQWRCA